MWRAGPEISRPSREALLKTVLLKQNSYTIQCTHLKCVIQRFLVYSQSCTTSTTINFRTFPHIKKKPHSHQQSLPSALLSQPLATKNFLSVSIHLPTLDILYKWNHIVCALS